MLSPGGKQHPRSSTSSGKRGPSEFLVPPQPTTTTTNKHLLHFRLLAIREKLAEQKKHIEELDRHMYNSLSYSSFRPGLTLLPARI
jgi:hypothetical protein